MYTYGFLWLLSFSCELGSFSYHLSGHLQWTDGSTEEAVNMHIHLIISETFAEFCVLKPWLFFQVYVSCFQKNSKKSCMLVGKLIEDKNFAARRKVRMFQIFCFIRWEKFQVRPLRESVLEGSSTCRLHQIGFHISDSRSFSLNCPLMWKLLDEKAPAKGKEPP